MMLQSVYWICSIVSIGCAVLLLRSYLRSRQRLLFWACGFFVCFAISNVILVMDLVLFPQIELIMYRNGFTLAGVILLLYGLIWETK